MNKKQIRNRKINSIVFIVVGGLIILIGSITFLWLLFILGVPLLTLGIWSLATIKNDKNKIKTERKVTQSNVENHVYTTQKSKRYHSDFDCCGMENPLYIPESQAKAMNKKPCKKCMRLRY